jgi:ATP-dependent helicase HrpA
MTPDFETLSRDIAACMLRDQHRLRQRLRGLERQRRDAMPSADTASVLAPMDEARAQIDRQIQRSREIRTRRQQNRPSIVYPPELPIVQRKDEIADIISRRQVTIVAGETGSGKTTQIPKICLELGRGISAMIGHTQPRRIAARSVATRVAEELASELGHYVGYKVRFGDHVSADHTYIKLMTDGILLAETQSDRRLEEYDTIIIDEAHERSLNIDFLVGYLKQLLPMRPDLKLIITSATIDPVRFSRHFNDAPIVDVSGRTYPVEIRYRPLKADDPDEDDIEQIDGILAAVDELSRDVAGDTLVFLSGEREIRQTAEALRKHHPAETEVVPLYARLSAQEQMRVFHPGQRRRIVLATNVAETSLTVPRIRSVVDTGLARISRYSPRTKVQRLPIEPVSRASADQRKGRCGRVAAGVCVRLYSADDYEKRAEFTEPEILRTSLASVILQMKSLRLGNVEDFPFLEPPDPRQIRDGYATLHELGAVDDHNALTEVGQALARLPVDPRIGRMILAAREENVVEDVLIIASALSVQDPRDRPLENPDAADQAHAKFRDETSDFLTFLHLWNWFHEQEKHLSGSKLRKACRANFISYMRMREWRDVHEQLRELVMEMGLHRPANPQAPAAPRRARKRAARRR